MKHALLLHTPISLVLDLMLNHVHSGLHTFHMLLHHLLMSHHSGTTHILLPFFVMAMLSYAKPGVIVRPPVVRIPIPGTLAKICLVMGRSLSARLLLFG